MSFNDLFAKEADAKNAAEEAKNNNNSSKPSKPKASTNDRSDKIKQ